MFSYFSKLFKGFTLPDTYKSLIADIASGDRTNITQAIRGHRQFLRTNPTEYRQTLEYGLMHEIDNPIPDLLLRAHYRKRILAEHAGRRAI